MDNKCVYCQPINRRLGQNLLDDDDIQVAISSDGCVEVYIEIETGRYDEFADWAEVDVYKTMKRIAYCPMCGRKLD